MIHVKESTLVARYVIAVLVGMLLGASLFTFIAYEDCIDKGIITLSDKTFYCSVRYGDTINEK